MPTTPHDIEADLHFLTTEEGGRSGPARGEVYRPACDFGLRGTYVCVVLEFTDREWAEPGETVPRRLWFVSPELQSERLYEGFTFDMWEGKVTGKGTITRVCNDAMIKPDKR
jgi:translation elongation factor EF-Tu-like GTPase